MKEYCKTKEKKERSKDGEREGRVKKKEREKEREIERVREKEVVLAVINRELDALSISTCISLIYFQVL